MAKLKVAITNEIKIDKNVPYSPFHRQNRYPFREMEVGDSFLFPEGYAANRNCIYWPTENKGFMGLAAMGPVKGARVGPAADISLRDITSVMECTPEATQAWEHAPWSR